MTEARDPEVPREDAVTADERADVVPEELSAWISVVPAIAERLTGVVDPAQLARAVEDELSAGLGASAVVHAEAADDGAGFSPLVIEGASDETRSWLSRTDHDPAWLLDARGRRLHRRAPPPLNRRPGPSLRVRLFVLSRRRPSTTLTG